MYKPLVVIALSVAVGAVVLELGLRYLGIDDPVLYTRDDTVGYRLKPNQTVSFYGNEIAINGLGVRDSRAFDTKSPNTKRILVLGDSVTWGGVRVAQTELFTHILENALDGVEVINAGVNGYSVRQMAELYREYLTALQPDIVIMYVIPGDFLRPPVVDLVRPSPAFPFAPPTFALSSALASARIVGAARFGWNWLQPQSPSQPRDDLDDRERVRRNVEAILQLNEGLESNQRLIVAVSPYPKHPHNPPLPESVAQELKGANIPLWVLDDGHLRVQECFADHVHLSPEGHARVAQELAKRLGAVLSEQVNPAVP